MARTKSSPAPAPVVETAPRVSGAQLAAVAGSRFAVAVDGGDGFATLLPYPHTGALHTALNVVVLDGDLARRYLADAGGDAARAASMRTNDLVKEWSL